MGCGKGLYGVSWGGGSLILFVFQDIKCFETY